MNLAGDRTQLYLEEAVANENEGQGHKKVVVAVAQFILSIMPPLTMASCKLQPVAIPVHATQFHAQVEINFVQREHPKNKTGIGVQGCCSIGYLRL